MTDTTRIVSPTGLERDYVVKVNFGTGFPKGKVADVELHFQKGALRGLKLVGFAVWERRTGSGRNVTVPARTYSVNGEARSFALLRPIADNDAMDTLRADILECVERAEQVEQQRVCNHCGGNYPAGQSCGCFDNAGQ